MLMASEPRYFLAQVTETEIIESRQTWLKKAWHDDVSRADLILAEIHRLNSRFSQSSELIKQAEMWILSSASQEHISLLWHTKAKLALDSNNIQSAKLMNMKAINIARQCGLNLYLVDFLNLCAELKLRDSKGYDALEITQEAYNRAIDAQCQYMWAAATSKHLMGKALLVLNRKAEAIPVLTSALELREQLGDAQCSVTRQLLDQMHS